MCADGPHGDTVGGVAVSGRECLARGLFAPAFSYADTVIEPTGTNSPTAALRLASELIGVVGLASIHGGPLH